MRRKDLEDGSWFKTKHRQSPLSAVAYFSMEFMLNETLPIYSGGLGNVAGDQLKAASDLGVPVIGLGLLYQQGYFRQLIDKDGSQKTSYPYNDPDQLPVAPLRQPNGQWLRLEVKLPGYSLWLRAWQVQVGRVRLYLLDTNDAANFPLHRGITSELYGGGPELRIGQEMVLGLGAGGCCGSWGFEPQVCHLNEGHAAFTVLERARDFMEDTGQSFEAALAATRVGNLFTTHTPVAAGFDRFSPRSWKNTWGVCPGALKIPMQEMMALGRQNPDDPSESFNMAYLAMRGSGAVNGVSRLHGTVSRVIFAPLYPRWPTDEVPVGYVTNGVHTPSWDSPEADALWTTASGKDRWLGETEKLQHDIRQTSDERLWRFRGEARQALVNFVRECLPLQLSVSGAARRAISGKRGMRSIPTC